MRIHFDLTHPKQSLFFSPLMEELRKRGVSISISTRGFGRYGTSIIDILKAKNVPETPVIIGEYSNSKLGKLQMYCRRTAGIAELLDANKADGVVCLSSPEAARAAFGMGVKFFCFNDIPEAYHTAKLTIPFADYVFHPFCIPPESWNPYIGKGSKIVFYKYNALDPIIWLKDIKIDKEAPSKIGINEPYILVKHTPIAASFLEGTNDPIPKVVNKLTDMGIKVLVHSYDTGLARLKMPNAPTLKGFVDLQSLIYNAKVLLTGGGTTSIEAAYFNTPVVSMRPMLTSYDYYLIHHGFMNYSFDPEVALRLVLEAYDCNPIYTPNPLHEMVFPVEDIAETIIGEIE